MNNIVGINSRGSLIIPKKLVDTLGLDENALFAIEKKGNDLYLKSKQRSPKRSSGKKEISACYHLCMDSLGNWRMDWWRLHFVR